MLSTAFWIVESGSKALDKFVGVYFFVMLPRPLSLCQRTNISVRHDQVTQRCFELYYEYFVVLKRFHRQKLKFMACFMAMEIVVQY